MRGDAESNPRLEDATVNLGDTSVDIDLWINTDGSSPVDSATFTVDTIADFVFSSVSIYGRNGWGSVETTPKFGSTDFGWLANPITSDSLFATMTFTFAADFFQLGCGVDIAFSAFELADDRRLVYGVVPIPGTVLLLGSGLVGLAAFASEFGRNDCLE